MAVNLVAPDPQSLRVVKGLRIGVAEAGVRKIGRKDLTVFQLDAGSSVAAVFTQNRFCAAPVQVCREHLGRSSGIRALVINTGNANAGTGAEGVAASKQTCAALAALIGCPVEAVLPYSTGVIMEMLPTDRIIAGLPAALADLKVDNWLQAAQGIMTTDTLPKAASASVTLGGTEVTITGVAKGAGMIRPNMATMLGFIATDACIAAHLMQELALDVANQSFNCITVDGDTSTNDSMTLIATGKAANAAIDSWDDEDAQRFRAALMNVAQRLAQAIVRDGEGATKFIAVQVDGGHTPAECRQVAYAIAHSPLVKTAFFASDPNLGRILAAVGYAGIADLDQTKIALYLDDVCVARNGGRDAHYHEADGQCVMRQSEIVVRVDLGRGSASQTVWTCDLSHDYVSINADYRS